MKDLIINVPDEWSEAYIAWRKCRNAIASSEQAIDWLMRDCFRYIRRHGLTFQTLTTAEVAKWRSEALAKGCGVNGVRHKQKLLRSYCEFCVGTDRMLRNPVNTQILPPLVKQKIIRYPFTHDQYQRVLAESCRLMRGTRVGQRKHQHYWHPAIVLGWHTGLRISDVASLTWRDINWDEGIITVAPIKKRRFRETLIIPMDPELDQYLLEFRKLHYNPTHIPGYLLPVFCGSYFTKKSHVDSEFRAICDPCGLTEHSFHSFRHGFVTRLLNAGVDPITIGSMTGQTIEQIKEYAHISVDAQRAALSQARKALFIAKQATITEVDNISITL